MRIDELTRASTVDRWSAAWNSPALLENLSVALNPNLSRTLARCIPSAAVIELNPLLLDAPAEILDEVLCHELAHWLVAQKHGPSAKSHGPEWRTLVEQAGYDPRRTIPWFSDPGPSRLPSGPPTPTLLYRHICRVCHATRIARRSVPSWRCVACQEAGLEGLLDIESFPNETAR